METELLYHVPLLLIFIALILICIGVAEICGRRGRIAASQDGGQTEHFNEVLPTSILGLLALLLGFTFAMALARYDHRETLVVKEANAIGTVYLRTDLLPEPFAAQVRKNLYEYTAHRDEFYPKFRNETAAFQARTNILLNHLWKTSMEATKGEKNPIAALYISSVNDIIDTDGERTHANLNHVPETVYFVMIFITLFGLGSLSFIAGYKNQKKIAFYFLSVLFPIVIVMIMDLDRPGRGLIRVSEQNLTDLLRSLEPTSAK